MHHGVVQPLGRVLNYRLGGGEVSGIVEMPWHPDDDTLELLVLGMLVEPQVSTVLNHILLCELCCEKAMRDALIGEVVSQELDNTREDR